MNKKISVILLSLNIVFTIIAIALIIPACQEYCISYQWSLESFPEHTNEYARERMLEFIFAIIFMSISLISSFFFLIKTIKDPISITLKSRKTERLARKQAKAEAEKQKQIAELEQKLDELKKD